MPKLDPRDPRRHRIVSILSAVLFVIAFPLATYLVPGGVMFGAFMVTPVTLIAWNRGKGIWVRAALVGILHAELVSSAHRDRDRQAEQHAA